MHNVWLLEDHFIVSKALDKSINKAPPKAFLSKAFFQFSINDRSTCCELKPILYPQKQGDRQLLM